MSTKAPSVALVLALVLGIGLVPLAAGAAPARKPNIVILLADDLGFADLGFHGCRDIPTPHLDALARGGVVCTNGYVSGPYCSPTRAALITGRYQQRFGHEFNPGARGGAAPFGLPLAETTLAARLKSAGYATGLVGKWHLGGAEAYQPQNRGFDEFFGFLGGAHSYFPVPDPPILRAAKPVDETAYLTDALAREAVSYIERHKDHPFFLFLSFNAVHTPMQAPPDRLARFDSISDPQRRTYAAMLSALDDAVGQVRSALKSASLDEHTLVFFFSDNGGPTMEGTTVNGSSNHPFRGSKRTTLEGGIHVPFVLSWKGTLPENKVYDSPVIQLDIAPTALAAAGVEIDPAWKLDGVDLRPYLEGKRPQPPHDALYWRLGSQTAIRQGDWKLVRYDQTVDRPGTRSNPGQGIAVTPPRLYNLAADPGEQTDLATQQPQRAAELERAWQTWSSQLAEPLWGDRPARARAPAAPQNRPNP
jgi:arylsulfatase A-like enzyme